jgi:hypothetical protein
VHLHAGTAAQDGHGTVVHGNVGDVRIGEPPSTQQQGPAAVPPPHVMAGNASGGTSAAPEGAAGARLLLQMRVLGTLLTPAHANDNIFSPLQADYACLQGYHAALHKGWLHCRHQRP